jgi:HEAT repeat protein
MTHDFKVQLINSIPFEETDEFYDKYYKGVDTITNLGVNSPEEMTVLLQKGHFNEEITDLMVNFLMFINYKSAIRVLIQIAQEKSYSIQLRFATICCLARLGHSKVYRTVRKFALTASEPKLRIAAIVAFIIAPSKRGFNTIIEVIKSDSDSVVRGEAIRAIGSMRKNDREVAFDLMLTKLQDTCENVVVRAYAVEGLGFLRDTRAISIVINYLQHEAPEIRYMSAYALGCLGDLSHLPLLQAMLNDDAVFEGWGTVANGAIEGINQLNSRIACAFESGALSMSTNKYVRLTRKDLISL